MEGWKLGHIGPRRYLGQIIEKHVHSQEVVNIFTLILLKHCEYVNHNNTCDKVKSKSGRPKSRSLKLICLYHHKQKILSFSNPR